MTDREETEGMPEFRSKLQPAKAGQSLHETCAPDQRSGQGFKIVSDYKMMGDQPQDVEKLVNGIKAGKKHQTLMGVTGSGKTFTMANIIEQVQKPTLVISHNKTLAAQLHGELKEFFPENAVEYFVS